MKKVLLTFLSVLSIGCSAPTSTMPVQSVMMPLSIGNNWTYRVTFDSMGTTLVHNVFDSVVGTKLLSGEEWTEVKRYSATGYRPFSFYYQNRPDGLYEYWDSSFTFHNAKYPTQPGDTFYYFGGSPHGSFPITVQSTSHSITIPAGTFDAYYYSTNNHDSLGIGSTIGPLTLVTATETEYYPGIGLLRSVDTIVHQTFELVSYQLH